MTRKLTLNEPDVSRVVEGLRDTGYSFAAAVSDLIDNSIEAGASVIDIVLDLGTDDSAVFWLADNGSGMTEGELKNAMRYGADVVAEIHRLGKYGLGLKTASSSFCRRLTVISKKGKSESASIKAASWDLDLVKERNNWFLEIGDAEPDLVDVFKEAMTGVADLAGAQPHRGTVVLWEKIDRLLLTRDGTQAVRRKQVLTRIVTELSFHLSMVFQRFLDPSNSEARNVKIRVNDTELEHWDPFCEMFDIKPVLKKRWNVSLPARGKSEVTMRAFILPKPTEYEDDSVATEYDEYRRTAVTARQGFFVYREGRLLEEGRWYGFGSHDTHLKALRIEVNFTADADELFGVGLRKEGLLLGDELIDVLREVVPGLRKDANALDRSGTAKKIADDAGENRTIDRMIGRRQTNLTGPTLEGTGKAVELENVHTDGAWQIVDEDGKVQPGLGITVVDGDEHSYVKLVPTVDSNALWMPVVYRTETNRHAAVHINTSHEWFVRAYAPHGSESEVGRAIDMLLWALANAEMNNVKPEFEGELEEFRIQVSRNLRQLAKDLPEFNPDD
jgi:hypothetical protein